MGRRLASGFLLLLLIATPASARGVGYRLVSVSLAGTHRLALLRNEQIDVLDFSPSRKEIVFARPGAALYVGAPNGKHSAAILKLGGSEIRDAAWAPDGRRLAVTVYGKLPQDGTTCGISVWTLEPDGSHLQKVADCAALSVNNLAAPSPWGAGAQLVFVGHLAPPSRTAGVLTISSSDGSGQRSLSGIAEIRDVALSPRGDWVAYDQAVGRKLKLSVVRLRDGKAVSLGSGQQPAWSKDGRRLAFRLSPSAYGRAGTLASVSVGSSISRPKVFSRVAGGALPTWSPSGRAIAYVGYACRKLTPRCENAPQIYVVATATGRTRRVSNEHDFGVISFQRLWWSRAGRAMFFTRSRSGV